MKKQTSKIFKVFLRLKWQEIVRVLKIIGWTLYFIFMVGVGVIIGTIISRATNEFISLIFVVLLIGWLIYYWLKRNWEQAKEEVLR